MGKGERVRSSICAAVILAFALVHPVPAQNTGGPTLRLIETNGIKMRIAEEGQGPLVLLLHGWPESWYSWRHQLPAWRLLVFTPSHRTCAASGKTDKPPAVGDYDIQHLTADIVGVIDALGKRPPLSSGTTGGRSSRGTACCCTPTASPPSWR